MSIIDQSKKYWISYIRRYDSQKFIDKTFEEIEFLNDKISQYHIEEREYLDRIKYLEKKLDIEKNKGIYGENPKVMILFIKVITLEDKTIQNIFLYFIILLKQMNIKNQSLYSLQLMSMKLLFLKEDIIIISITK